MKNLLLCFIATGILVFAGCRKTTTTTTPPAPTYDNTFTIDGGVFKKTVVNFKNVTSNTGSYNDSAKNTTVVVLGNSGDSLNLGYEIDFEGNKTGSYNLGSALDIISLSVSPVSDPTNIKVFQSNAGGVVTISQYGAVGGTIAGTFGGGFNANGDEYTITNGKFSAKRTPDTK
jgi:hypothetical protein